MKLRLFIESQNQGLYQGTLNHLTSTGLGEDYKAGWRDFDGTQASYMRQLDISNPRRKTIVSSYHKSDKIGRRSSGGASTSSMSLDTWSHEISSSSDDSGWSEGSTRTSRNVGLTRVKTSCMRNVKLVGFVEALGIFVWGKGWVIGAHTDDVDVEKTVNTVIEKVRICGTATDIKVIKEEGDASDAAATDAMIMLREAFPHAHLTAQAYAKKDMGDYEFQASVKHPGDVKRVYHRG